MHESVWKFLYQINLVLITDSIPADESNQETENVLEISKALSIRVHGGKILMGSFTDSVVREDDNSGAKVVHQKVPQKVQQKVHEKVQPKIHEKVQRYQGDSGNPSIILCQYFKFFAYVSITILYRVSKLIFFKLQEMIEKEMNFIFIDFVSFK